MQENQNIEFLNRLYKTCEMGIIGINDVITKAQNKEFKKVLETQKKEYNYLLEETSQIFTSYGTTEKKLSEITHVSSQIASDMQLLNNKEDSTIAKMMIKGTKKGIDNISKFLKEYNGEDKEINTLALNLLSTLKNNIKDLKIYL